MYGLKYLILYVFDNLWNMYKILYFKQEIIENLYDQYFKP